MYHSAGFNRENWWERYRSHQNTMADSLLASNQVGNTPGNSFELICQYPINFQPLTSTSVSLNWIPIPDTVSFVKCDLICQNIVVPQSSEIYINVYVACYNDNQNENISYSLLSLGTRSYIPANSIVATSFMLISRTTDSNLGLNYSPYYGFFQDGFFPNSSYRSAASVKVTGSAQNPNQGALFQGVINMYKIF